MSSIDDPEPTAYIAAHSADDAREHAVHHGDFYSTGGHVGTPLKVEGHGEGVMVADSPVVQDEDDDSNPGLPDGDLFDEFKPRQLVRWLLAELVGAVATGVLAVETRLRKGTE